MSKKLPPLTYGSVRIIGGLFRRRVVQFPAAEGVRPTPDRVRETLFNWLGQNLNGWSVCDLFAGSGGLSLEALSREAQEVIAFESYPLVAKSLQENASILLDSLPNSSTRPTFQVIAKDVRHALPLLRPQHFDLMLADPPFGAFDDWYTFILDTAQHHLKPEGWLYIESPRPLEPTSRWSAYRTLKAGQVYAHLWQQNGETTF